MTYPIPVEGSHRLADLLSENVSNETIASTARWFAELMIDKFLSDSAKARLTKEKFCKLSLGQSIKEIEKDFAPKLIQALQLIKSLGDRASHYKKGQNLSAGEANIAAKTALNLFNLILIDELTKRPLNATKNRSTIFSTLMPGVREHVLMELLKVAAVDAGYSGLLKHKYVLACTKNGKKQKAKEFLDEQFKKNLITEGEYEFESKSIIAIDSELQSGVLPVAKSLQDAKRNFNEVLKTLSDQERKDNDRLISIIDRLLDEVNPSEMGDLIGGACFIV